MTTQNSMSVIKMLEQFEADLRTDTYQDDLLYEDYIDHTSSEVLPEIDLMYADFTSQKCKSRMKHQRRNSPKAKMHRERRRHQPAQQVEQVEA
jgi:hypothetical protein